MQLLYSSLIEIRNNRDIIEVLSYFFLIFIFYVFLLMFFFFIFQFRRNLKNKNLAFAIDPIRGDVNAYVNAYIILQR